MMMKCISNVSWMLIHSFMSPEINVFIHLLNKKNITFIPGPISSDYHSNVFCGMCAISPCASDVANHLKQASGVGQKRFCTLDDCF